MHNVLTFGVIIFMLLSCAPKIIAESGEPMKLNTLGYEEGREPLKILADPSQIDIDFEYIGSGVFNYKKVCQGSNLDFSADNTLWEMAHDEKQAQGLGKSRGFQPPSDFDYARILLITYGRRIVGAEGILYEQFLHWDDAVALALTFDEGYERGCVFFYGVPDLRYLLSMTTSPSYLMIDGERKYMGENVFDMNVLAVPPEDEVWQ